MNTLKYHLDSHRLKSFLSIEKTINDAVKIMKENNDSFVIVQDQGQCVGIFTESDLKNRVVAKNLSLDSTTLGTVMTENVVFFNIEDSIDESLDKLDNNNFRHLPIIKNGKVVAVLTARNLLKVALKQIAEEREQLMEYITT